MIKVRETSLRQLAFLDYSFEFKSDERLMVEINEHQLERLLTVIRNAYDVRTGNFAAARRMEDIRKDLAEYL